MLGFGLAKDPSLAAAYRQVAQNSLNAARGAPVYREPQGPPADAMLMPIGGVNCLACGF